MLTTDNLKLPLYEPTDLADLTDGYNAAMNILDENDSALAENISTTADKITNGYKAADIEIKNEIKDINAIVTDQETLIANNAANITNVNKLLNFTINKGLKDVTPTIRNLTCTSTSNNLFLNETTELGSYKLSGEITVAGITTSGANIAIDFTNALTNPPKEEFEVCLGVSNLFNPVYVKFKTNGTITLVSWVTSSTTSFHAVIMPCLIIAKNFGDTSTTSE